MKDQYVGDLNDFFKYALLRALAAAHGGRFVVAWMKTADDGRADGLRLSYLNEPQRFRAVDPVVFDALSRVVDGGRRSIAAVEEEGFLPAEVFWTRPVDDAQVARRDWFQRLHHQLARGDLVFFDPDNGLEVPSVPPGRAKSSKYLQWSELATALDASRTVCVYQHFARRARDGHLRELAARIRTGSPDVDVAAVETAHVAFLLAGPPDGLEILTTAAERLSGRTPHHMTIRGL